MHGMQITPEMAAKIAELIAFAQERPDAFLSALINTIDTSHENAEFRNIPYQDDREDWAITFLNGHRED